MSWVRIAEFKQNEKDSSVWIIISVRQGNTSRIGFPDKSQKTEVQNKEKKLIKWDDRG